MPARESEEYVEATLLGPGACGRAVVGKSAAASGVSGRPSCSELAIAFDTFDHAVLSGESTFQK